MKEKKFSNTGSTEINPKLTVLNKLFVETMKRVADFPEIGRKTDFDETVSLKIVRDYLVFYEYDESQIKILAVWDGNRDEKLKIK